MIAFEEIKKYLPQYLSSVSQDKLFEDLKNFPENIIEKKFYSLKLGKDKTIFQGDGLEGILVVNLPDVNANRAPVLVISNTCDIDPSNKRISPTRMAYAPIFNVEKYENFLIKDHVESERYSKKAIKDHIESIKKQYVSHIFYLPKGSKLQNDSIVFLDRLNNHPLIGNDNGDPGKIKLFTLSDYGFYVFLLKLTIHFARIREGIERPTDDS